MNNNVRAALYGAVAGGIATLPMSGVMLAADKIGLMGEHPPETIIEAAADAAGVRHGDHPAKDTAVAFAHLGYGMLAGSIFGLLQEELPSSISPVTQGIGYGLLIWVVSYKGWIPALEIMPPPEHDRPGRPASMIAAHVVYGAVLGESVARLSARQR